MLPEEEHHQNTSGHSIKKKSVICQDVLKARLLDDDFNQSVATFHYLIYVFFLKHFDSSFAHLPIRCSHLFGMAPKQSKPIVDEASAKSKAVAKPKAAPAPAPQPVGQMSDEQLVQLGISTQFQEQIAGSSTDTMGDLIQRMQALSVKYQESIKYAKGYYKELSKAGRQEASKAKAKERNEAKKIEGARLRNENITLIIVFVPNTAGTPFRLTTVRSTTVGTLRLMIGQHLAMSRVKSMKLELLHGTEIITEAPRKTLLKLEIGDQDTITVRLNAPETEWHPADDDDSETATTITQETVDAMLARDLEEFTEDESEQEMEVEEDEK
eukprot:symbB.v1.2.021199.t1/scaffold1820.1/size101099/1